MYQVHAHGSFITLLNTTGMIEMVGPLDSDQAVQIPAHLFTKSIYNLVYLISYESIIYES